MENEIPQAQLDKVKQLVASFLTAFHQLELTIPLETECAVIYQLQPGERQ